MTGKEQNGVVFRESFRGYQKDDVNRYITQIHEQFARENERTQKELRRLNDRIAEAEALRPALEDAKGQVEALNKKLTSCNEIASQAQQQKTDMAEQLAQLRAEKEALASENAALHAKMEQMELHSAESVKSSAENEENAKRYESMSHKIGDIILSAKAEAEEIIEDARQKSDEMLAEADRQAKEKQTNGILRTKQLLLEADERIRVQSAQYAAECSLLLTEMNGKLADIQSHLKNSGSTFIKNGEAILSELQGKITQADAADGNEKN